MNNQIPTESELALADLLLPMGCSQTAEEKNRSRENITAKIMLWTRCDGRTAEEWRVEYGKAIDDCNAALNALAAYPVDDLIKLAKAWEAIRCTQDMEAIACRCARELRQLAANRTSAANGRTEARLPDSTASKGN